ncbi:hypothetical protein ACFQBQ_04210 [Granulicella cerasi]|uniref:Uncharacterized protein n=1 Tax=Granulicella cerasi TaxID=741063 RepID=A0ABW1Z5H6_9BACT|nr:hypothetical protein [Granulicella cerasi]
MKRFVVAVLCLGLFVALFPVSFAIAGRYVFTRPFDPKSTAPLLLVCGDHVETVPWAALEHSAPTGAGCSFQVTPERQKWVEEQTRKMQLPGEASWVISVKQLGEQHQRVDLYTMGDGEAGMIYEVDHGKVTPLRTRKIGPVGTMVVLVINVLLWLVVCFGVAGVLGMRETHV